MKYAISDGQRIEAQPGLSGECVGCGHHMMAKCGEINDWHWAHRGKRVCDQWWEPETPWHRDWKGQFPKEWQEIVQHAENDEKHIADVKTCHGYVIEFQHSHIKPVERQSREDFYKKMIWIVDGTRRMRDKDNFFESLMYLRSIDGRDDLRESPGIFRNPLVRDWDDSNVPVFFDFSEDKLWGLLPKSTAGKKYAFRVDRNALISSLYPQADSKLTFEDLLSKYTGTIYAHEFHLQRIAEQNRDPLLSMSRYWRR